MLGQVLITFKVCDHQKWLSLLVIPHSCQYAFLVNAHECAHCSVALAPSVCVNSSLWKQGESLPVAILSPFVVQKASVLMANLISPPLSAELLAFQ